MRILVTVLLLCAFVFAQQDSSKTKAAEEAAQTWLKLVDSGNYAQSWQAASKSFRDHVTQQQWEQAMQSNRRPFGKVLSRTLLKATYTTHLPGAPDGQYVVLQYNSSFEHKQSSVETVTPELEGGEWKISGYFVR